MFVKVRVENEALTDNIKASINVSRNILTLRNPCTSKDTCSPYILELIRGSYRIEMWGAGKKMNASHGGSGYNRGKLRVESSMKLYCYIGKVGDNWNYGTQCYHNNAGASTDIRLLGGNWDSTEGLRSRIMVTGGSGQGGGLNAWNSGDPYPGPAGGLTGFKGGNINSGSGGNGATQIGGSGFGVAYGILPGGNGYYAGYNGYCSNGVAGSGGGSSFISGHPKCDAVDQDGNHTGLAVHYSGISFSNTIMLDGLSFLPLPTGGNSYGYKGNGVIRITALDYETAFRITASNKFTAVFIIIFSKVDSN